LEKVGANMTIPRDVKLAITAQVYEKWSAIYDDRDDAEAEEAYANMYVKAMAEAEENYKNRSSSS